MLVSSSVHLETDGLADRLGRARRTEETGTPRSSVAGQGGSIDQTGAEDAPIPVTFITIPNHLLERLWLVDVPRMIEKGPEPQGEDGLYQWETIRILSLLAAAADEAFGQVARAVFHVSGRPGPEAQSDPPDISDAIGLRLRAAPDEGAGMVSWLNLDEHAHVARVAVRQSGAGSGTSGARDRGGVAAVELRLLPGEGILWDTRLLTITEGRAQPPNSAKLLLLGSDRGLGLLP